MTSAHPWLHVKGARLSEFFVYVFNDNTRQWWLIILLCAYGDKKKAKYMSMTRVMFQVNDGSVLVKFSLFRPISYTGALYAHRSLTKLLSETWNSSSNKRHGSRLLGGLGIQDANYIITMIFIAYYSPFHRHFLSSIFSFPSKINFKKGTKRHW